MRIVGGLNYTSCSESAGLQELTPELETALCLSWIKERLHNSKSDGASRIGAVFSNIGDLASTSQASLPYISVQHIESTARQLLLQAQQIASRTLTSDFSALARVALAHPQQQCLILVSTDKGHVYPTVAYKSGGKVAGLGSHLYVFLPVCGELKLPPKNAGEVLSNCVLLSPEEGEPVRYDAYVIQPYAPSAEAGPSQGAVAGATGTLRNYNNQLYASVAPVEHEYEELDGSTPPPEPSRPSPPPTLPRARPRFEAYAATKFRDIPDN